MEIVFFLLLARVVSEYSLDTAEVNFTDYNEPDIINHDPYRIEQYVQV
jgi:hypothetical protein